MSADSSVVRPLDAVLSALLVCLLEMHACPASCPCVCMSVHVCTFFRSDEIYYFGPFCSCLYSRSVHYATPNEFSRAHKGHTFPGIFYFITFFQYYFSIWVAF